jgi:hypothetical protein
MHRAYGLFQAVPPHRDRDRQLARSLRDRDDVDILPRNSREDASRQTRRASHPLADHREQPNVIIDLDWLKVAVLEFQRSRSLYPDARVGRLTRIVLYAASGGYQRPTLAAASGATS